MQTKTGNPHRRVTSNYAISLYLAYPNACHEEDISGDESMVQTIWKDRKARQGDMDAFRQAESI